jgi:hypothetical protein
LRGENIEENNISRLRQEAVRRTFEAQRRAVSPPESTRETPVIKKDDPEKNFISFLLNKSDASLLILIIILLAEEKKASPELIFSLLYAAL